MRLCKLSIGLPKRDVNHKFTSLCDIKYTYDTPRGGSMQLKQTNTAARLLVAGMFTTTAGLAYAQSQPIGAPQDWSHHALIVRQPKTPDELIATGRSADLNRLYRDPRYVASVLRRVEAEGRRSTLPAAASLSQAMASIRNPHEDRHRPRAPAPALAQRDWSNVLGGSTNGLGGTGREGTYPAKYHFDITVAPSCNSDFVVYPTNAPGATAANINLETYVSQFTGNPGQGSTRTVTVGLPGVRQVVLTSSVSDNTGKYFQTSSDNAKNAENLANAVNRWSSQTGYSATYTGSQITITANTNGNTANNALDENLNNFAGGNSWAGVNGSGTPGQATLIAFNQIYQGAGACNGIWNAGGTTKAPSVMWSYNTGTGYQAETSPSLSYLDSGKQVAFAQRSSNTLQLVVLKWKEGQGTAEAPATPDFTYTSGDGASYRSCANDVTKSCLITFDLQTTDNGATWSSPFVDYANDTLWIGDTTGHLHKFTGIFQGTPQRATPVSGITVETGMKLSSPVSDGDNVYIGSQSGGAGVGGKLHRINIASNTVFSSAKLANNNTIGLREGPIVDTGTNSVIAFLFNDGTAGNNTDCGPTQNNNDACRVIARFATGFANSAAPLQRVYVGRGNNPNSTLFSGAFDDAYYTSVTGTGAMYIVGGAPDDTFVPTLWKIPVTNGVFGTPVRGPTVGTRPGDCNSACLTSTYNWSPTTVIKTSATNEYLYFSMDQTTSYGGCTGACLLMINLSTSPWNTSTPASAYLQLPTGTGTSGISVDNINNSTTGARQIYFSNTGTTGNAIQASQDALD